MPPDQCRGGRDQQQGPGDHQAYLWTEVSEESVGPIDPGLESGVASDRLLDRAHPPDGQGPEGPIRLVLHLKTEEPPRSSCLPESSPRLSAPARPRGRGRLAQCCLPQRFAVWWVALPWPILPVPVVLLALCRIVD